MPSPNLPDRPTLDRGALERVLARAAELQASDPGEAPAERLTEAQLLELGREVGLSPQHLRQALAEERTRIATSEPHGNALERTLGPADATASRTIRGSAGAALQALDGWMQREECLRVLRRFDDRIVWEPRTDLVTSLRRSFDVEGRGYLLSKAQAVAATAVPIDESRTIVRLDADFSTMRRQSLMSSIVATTGASAIGAGAIVMGFFAPLVVVPVVAVSGASFYAANRRVHRTAARAQVTLEQILDRLERGELARPSLLTAIARSL